QTCALPISRDRDAALPALDRRSQPLEERALRAPRGPGAARARCAPPAHAHRMDDAGLTIVFRSRRRRECDERLLVLTAVGVEGFVAPAPDWSEFLLQVDVAQAELAVRHLAQYEAENRAPLPPPPPPSLYPHAWIGCAAYVLVLLGVAWVLSNGLVRLDAFDQGVLDAARVQRGEWWRAWTALTLHLDGPHLAANLGAGVWFGYLAGRQMGVGTAWLLTVTGAALANLLEGLTGPPEHQAVGASTAVFAALGAMSAHSWRERLQLPQRWARRWGPLVAGVILLGWTGSAGEGTDLVAHVAGFAVGAALGALAALPVGGRDRRDARGAVVYVGKPAQRIDIPQRPGARLGLHGSEIGFQERHHGLETRDLARQRRRLHILQHLDRIFDPELVLVHAYPLRAGELQHLLLHFVLH